MPPPDRDQPARTPVERFGTLIESDDEIRRAIAGNLGAKPGAASPMPPPPPPAFVESPPAAGSA